jgi:UDP-N-acetylglucosamine:LPS N-acetylglucosamine transferase
MMNSSQKLRVLAIASGGGHWLEMRRIMPAFEGLDVTYASVRPESREEALGRPYYTFDNFTRFNKLGAFRSFFQIWRIVRKVRPQVVISTGSAPPLFAMALGKYLFGARTIWIDSIANVDKLSGSGHLAKWVADIWLTQWQHLAGPKGPEFWGAVL